MADFVVSTQQLLSHSLSSGADLQSLQSLGFKPRSPSCFLKCLLFALTHGRTKSMTLPLFPFSSPWRNTKVNITNIHQYSPMWIFWCELSYFPCYLTHQGFTKNSLEITGIKAPNLWVATTVYYTLDLRLTLVIKVFHVRLFTKLVVFLPFQ